MFVRVRSVGKGGRVFLKGEAFLPDFGEFIHKNGRKVYEFFGGSFAGTSNVAIKNEEEKKEEEEEVVGEEEVEKEEEEEV